MNITLFYFLHSFASQSKGLDNLIWFLAVPLIYIMFFVGTIFIFRYYKISNLRDIINLIKYRTKDIFSIPLSAGLAWGIAEILKILIHTDRPFIILSDISPLFLESGYAFPSAHSTAISALAFAIFFKNRRLGYVFIATALLIGVARVMAGVHFPIDIIGGYAIGFLVAYFSKTR